MIASDLVQFLPAALDEQARQVTLTAKAVTPAKVAAWCPEKWSRPRIDVNGAARDRPHFKKYGGERFVIVPVEKGESLIVVQGE